jgi:hypothetical protein
MKIQYCSDLHLEFPLNKKYLMANPIKPEGEILLLAGDIITFTEIEKENDFFNFLSDSNEDSEEEDFTTDELIYTAITRCRQNLVKVNIGNQRYHGFLKEAIK